MHVVHDPDVDVLDRLDRIERRAVLVAADLEHAGCKSGAATLSRTTSAVAIAVKRFIARCLSFGLPGRVSRRRAPGSIGDTPVGPRRGSGRLDRRRLTAGSMRSVRVQVAADLHAAHDGGVPARDRAGRPPSRAGSGDGRRSPPAARSGSAARRQGLPSGPAASALICGIAVDQRLGVGVARRAEHLLGRPGLDDPAEIHHRDPVAEMAHHAEVVRDEHHGQLHARPAAA